MGDSRRFDLFAKLISKQFPNKNIRIADVAGGKGYLSLALKEQGYKNVEIFEPKKRKEQVKKVKRTYRMFKEDLAKGFDLIVGMHPDEATDVIINAAGKNSIPFAVCPCCVRPTVSSYWGQHSYGAWMKHLEKFAKELGFNVTKLMLKMNGKNIVLVGKKK